MTSLPPLSSVLSPGSPLVSVIVPSFNKAPFLAESVGSALAQTHRNVEVVVVNDGSTDDTNAVTRALQQKNPDRPIILLEKKNGGISDARNYAIERCNGQIVCCLDGDDIMQPDFVALGLAAMRTHNANLICCNVELFGAEGGEWKPKPYDRYGIRYNNDIPTLVMYDKALWQEMGGYSRAFPFNEDWEFFVRLSRGNLQVHKLEEKLFRYRVTTGGLAQLFIKDTWKWSVSLMITSNDALYPVEQVMTAHRDLAQMPDRWAERFRDQDKLHPNEWLLKFWLGLVEEGKSRTQAALDLYTAANQLTGGQQWQVLYRIGSLLEQQIPQTALQLLHIARVFRPDLTRFVQERIDKLAKPTA